MMPIDAVYRAVYIICQQAGDTYDFLPDASAKYPFIYVGEAADNDLTNSDLMGRVNQTVHLYGKRTDRTVLNDAIVAIRRELMTLKAYESYYLTPKMINIQRLQDNTDATPLFHYVLEMTITYTRRS